MINLILAVGWSQNPKRFDNRWNITSDFSAAGIRPILIDRPRRTPNWLATDDLYIAAIIRDHKPTYACGFSDGARPVLRATSLTSVLGLIFHSGVYIPEDLTFRPRYPILTIGGAKDWTTRIPIYGTNPLDLHADNVDRSTYYEHPGTHEWHVSTNAVIIDWINSLKSPDPE